MTKTEIVWGAVFAVIAAVVSPLAEAFLVPWMKSWDLTAASDGVESAPLKVVRFLTYPIEISLVTPLLLGILGVGIYLVVRHFRTVLVKPTQSPIPIPVVISTGVELTVNEEQAVVLALLGVAGDLNTRQIQGRTNWSQVRVDHVIDKLLNMKLVSEIHGYHGRVACLTPKGRAYVVENYLDEVS